MPVLLRPSSIMSQRCEPLSPPPPPNHLTNGFRSCFQVRARAVSQGQEERFSDASVTIKLLDINDNEPKFEQAVGLC